MLEQNYTVNSVAFDREFLVIYFSDGRILAAPLSWFPRLEEAPETDRAAYAISSFGLHWPTLNEDISLRGIFAGRGAECMHEDLNYSLSKLSRDLDGEG